MKAILSTAATALLLAACGSTAHDSNLQSQSVERNPVMSLVPVSGELMSVEQNTNRTASETKITIGFGLGCTNTLAPLSFKEHKLESGKLEIHVAAFEEARKLSLVSFCTQQFPTHAASITVNGTYEADDISLVFNKGDAAKAPQDLTKAIPTNDVGLGQVKALCAPDAKCKADGTVVNVVVGTSGCLDRAALSYSYEENDGKLDLYVGALNLGANSSKHVRCIVQNTEAFSISLIDQYYTADDIKLHVLSK